MGLWKPSSLVFFVILVGHVYSFLSRQTGAPTSASSSQRRKNGWWLPSSSSLDLSRDKLSSTSLLGNVTGHQVENGARVGRATMTPKKNETASASSRRIRNSREEVDMLRQMGRRGAFYDIIEYLPQMRKNVYTYTAAISALTPLGSEQASVLLNDMVRQGIQPNSYTFSACLRSAQGPKEVQSWLMRIRRDFDNVHLSEYVWEAAIISCARTEDSKVACEAAMQVFNESSLQSNHYRTAPRSFLALFEVARIHGNVTMATQVLDNLLLASGSQQLLPSPSLTPRLWAAPLQVCGVVGNPRVALEILNRMQDYGQAPNVHHYTAFLRALSMDGQVEKALDVLDHMIGKTTNATTPWGSLPPAQPDLVAIQAVLQGCSVSYNYGCAKLILERLQSSYYAPNISPDEQCYNLVLATCETPTQAKALVQEMRLSRRYRVGATPPSQFTYTKAITICRKAADIDTAVHFLNQSRNDNVQPDTYMYSAVVWTAARAGACDLIPRFLEEMTNDGCLPNTVSYNGLISCLLRSGRVHDAVSVYVDMIESGLVPSKATYKLLARSTRVMTDHEERLVILTRIFDMMGPREWCVNIGGSVIEVLIYTYGALGEYNEAKRVFDSIQGPCDTGTLRAILFVCSISVPPEWEDAMSILHASDIVGGAKGPAHMEPVALSIAMMACSKANQWEESLQLLRLYGNYETLPHAVNSLIAACGRSGRPDMAMEILNEMQEYGIRPDNHSYRNAIIACNQAEHERLRESRRNINDGVKDRLGWWECALSLLRRMREEGLEPDVQSYSSAISACEAAGQWQRALTVLQSMMDGSSTLNLYCFNAAISACEKGGAWVEALEVYERMKAHGGRHLRPNIVTLNSLIQALDKAGQKELAQSVFEEGMLKHIVNPWRMTKSITGNPILAMDLHQFSASMARAAIRSHFESMVRNSAYTLPKQDLTVIVGKGRRSESEPVLMPTVLRLLQVEYKIKATIDPENTGRIYISKETLNECIAEKKWH